MKNWFNGVDVEVPDIIRGAGYQVSSGGSGIYKYKFIIKLMFARLRFTRQSLRTVTSSSSTAFLPEAEMLEVEVEVFLSTSNMDCFAPQPAG